MRKNPGYDGKLGLHVVAAAQKAAATEGKLRQEHLAVIKYWKCTAKKE